MGGGKKRRNNEELFLNGLFKAAQSVNLCGLNIYWRCWQENDCFAESPQFMQLIDCTQSRALLGGFICLLELLLLLFHPTSFYMDKEQYRDSHFVVLPWVSWKNDLSINQQWFLFVCFSSTAFPFYNRTLNINESQANILCY